MRSELMRGLPARAGSLRRFQADSGAGSARDEKEAGGRYVKDIYDLQDFYGSDGDIARGEVAVQLVDVRAHLEPLVLPEALRIDPRAGDDDHPELGHALLRLRERGDHAPQQMPADPRAADGHDADLLVVAVAQCLAVAERGRVEARHVAGEVVVLLGP